MVLNASPQLVGLRAFVCVRWIRADGPHVTRSTPHDYLREPNLPTTGVQPSSRTLSGLIVGLIGGFGLSVAPTIYDDVVPRVVGDAGQIGMGRERAVGLSAQ